MNAEKPYKIGKASDGRPMHYSAGAVVKDEQGRIFLMDRQFEPYGFAGMAGHVDEGEGPLTALMREGREELGTMLKNVAYICEEEVPWNKCWKADVHYWHLYRAQVDFARIKVNPHEAKQWGFYEREVIPTLALEPVWKYWFTKLGIIKE